MKDLAMNILMHGGRKLNPQSRNILFFGGLDVDFLTKDELSDEVRQAIDLDFRLWMESITARAGVVPPKRQKEKQAKPEGIDRACRGSARRTQWFWQWEG